VALAPAPSSWIPQVPPVSAVSLKSKFTSTGASGLGVGSWDDLGDDPRLVAVSNHCDGMVNEALEAVDFVE
jgi:hypothetical protein